MDVVSVWERLLTGNVSSSELIGIAVGLGLGLLVWAVVLVRVFFFLVVVILNSAHHTPCV